MHPYTIILGILCALLEFAPFQCHHLDIGLGQDAMRHTHIPVPVGFWLCKCVTFHFRGYQLANKCSRCEALPVMYSYVGSI